MDRIDLPSLEIWFITGSQHLYGEETLRKVKENSGKIVEGLNASGKIASRVVWKPTVTRSSEITEVLREASASERCIGVIVWMHTFSPAKMWINGLKLLRKPLLHLHTQFNSALPWGEIDMDFMNLNQSAHGDREFGHICTKMGIRRKIVAGHWTDEEVLKRIGIWGRAAAAWHDSQTLRVARFGDNMRNVAVTEGDKVSAQIQFGYEVEGYGVGDLVEVIGAVGEKEIDALLEEYRTLYDVRGDLNSIREAARQEIGIRRFLDAGQFSAFTTTFEDLHGLSRLPGLAAQRLMADGYGFGAEGDWKTAALVRSLKAMSSGLPGGTSFMEDYTYHLEKGRERVLGAHMLEVCPSLASERPSLEVHPLGIGGKSAPARLVFDSTEGPALNASLIDLGDRFRLIVNEVDAVRPDAALPELPVARAVWIPRPDLRTSAERWIAAGGAHHTVYSRALTPEYLEDFAGMAGIEMNLINGKGYAL